MGERIGNDGRQARPADHWREGHVGVAALNSGRGHEQPVQTNWVSPNYPPNASSQADTLFQQGVGRGGESIKIFAFSVLSENSLVNEPVSSGSHENLGEQDAEEDYIAIQTGKTSIGKLKEGEENE